MREVLLFDLSLNLVIDLAYEVLEELSYYDFEPYETYTIYSSSPDAEHTANNLRHHLRMTLSESHATEMLAMLAKELEHIVDDELRVNITSEYKIVKDHGEEEKTDTPHGWDGRPFGCPD